MNNTTRAAAGMLVGTSIALLSGCLGPTRAPPTYYKTDASPAQFEADKSQCLYQVEMRGAGREFLYLFDLCMRGKGYMT